MNPEKTRELYYKNSMTVQPNELEQVVRLRSGGNDSSSSDDQPFAMGDDENMEGQHPAIPTNTPPRRAIFKTPGPRTNPFNALPLMSSRVMTPTEQRQLQEAFSQMRMFALNRSQPCPYEGCRAYFSLDAEGMISFRKHLEASHMGTNCPFCTTPLFAHWTPSQIKDHFITNHADFFSNKGDLRRDTGAKVQNLGRTHRREEQWNFCARCGRNHTLLATTADRTNHDNRCYPGLVPASSETKHCRDCGQRDPPSTEGHLHHVCTATAEEKSEHVYCTGCALPTHYFSRVYAQKHLAHCKGVGGSTEAGWCPWCGVALEPLGPARLLQHLDACGLKPPTGEGPVDTSTGAPGGSPGQVIIPVPDRCPFERCRADEAEWRPREAEWLAEHFSEAHPGGETQAALGGGEMCPLCGLNFAARRFHTDGQRAAHFDDHVHRRAVRIVADKVIASCADWSDPTVRLLLEQRDDASHGMVAVESERERSGDRQTVDLQEERIEQLKGMPSPNFFSALHIWNHLC